MMTEKMEILFFLTDYFSFGSVWGGGRFNLMKGYDD